MNVVRMSVHIFGACIKPPSRLRLLPFFFSWLRMYKASLRTLQASFYGQHSLKQNFQLN